MNIAVVGASGFIGSLLVGRLSQNKGNFIHAISRHHVKLSNKNVKYKTCDIFNTKQLIYALQGCDIAYYLVHMMSSSSSSFYTLEEKAAASFNLAAKNAGIKKVIYLGGLGKDKPNLSKHLKSRHLTGESFRATFNDVIEFRASIIVGAGSTSFETIKLLTNKFNFMILPRWANTLTQPICAKDVVEYLVLSADGKYLGQKIYEIGGPRIYSYKDLIRSYSGHNGKPTHIFVIKFLPRWPAKIWLTFLIDTKYKKTAIAMIDSLENQVIVTNNLARLDFSEIIPQSIEAEF